MFLTTFKKGIFKCHRYSVAALQLSLFQSTSISSSHLNCSECLLCFSPMLVLMLKVLVLMFKQNP